MSFCVGARRGLGSIVEDVCVVLHGGPAFGALLGRDFAASLLRSWLLPNALAFVLIEGGRFVILGLEIGEGLLHVDVV
jgi:hypothetical protein